MVLVLEEEDPKSIRHVVRELKSGGLVAIPCDTVYSLSCDATDEEAVARLFEAKERPQDKPVSVAVHDPEDAMRLLEENELVRKAFELLTPGPVTVVARMKEDSPIASNVTADRETLGVRVPDHHFFLRVVRKLGKPIVTTSANVSGEPAPSSPDEVLEQLGDKIDVLVEGKCKYRRPSTVIEITGSRIEVIREGVIPRDDILKTLGVTTR